MGTVAQVAQVVQYGVGMEWVQSGYGVGTEWVWSGYRVGTVSVLIS